MSETSKLILSIIFMSAGGIFLIFFEVDMVGKIAGGLSLGLAIFGAFYLLQKNTKRGILSRKPRGEAESVATTQSGMANITPVAAPETFVGAPIPPLSPRGVKQIKRAVSVLASFGVFSPQIPSACHLYEAAADYGEPVTLEAVFIGLDEASYYHPDFDMTQYSANLVFLPAKTEQFEDVIEEQLRDIVKLYGGAIEIWDLTVSIIDPWHVSIKLSLNNEHFECEYDGIAKYLSSTPFVEIAKRLHAIETDKRLALFWSDQGARVTLISDGTLKELNAALGKGLLADANFSWLDEETPFDASSIASISPQ